MLRGGRKGIIKWIEEKIGWKINLKDIGGMGREFKERRERNY